MPHLRATASCSALVSDPAPPPPVLPLKLALSRRAGSADAMPPGARRMAPALPADAQWMQSCGDIVIHRLGWIRTAVLLLYIDWTGSGLEYRGIGFGCMLAARG